MANRLSRRKMAAFAADKLAAGSSPADALREVAAYLVTSGRTREQELLVRDIEDAMAARGIVVADVASAHSLDASIEAEIKALTGAKSLQLRKSVDETLLGGIRIDIPGKRFDGTIRHKLNALKAKQL
ncbi:MAG TPA: F0F1 ATP synthase subunit delta [Candidatus Saccharimonadales bacterium]|nr:F0F1 ATP synthase subunit delta [Candidatus Saccharimonadales bacterium]